LRQHLASPFTFLSDPEGKVLDQLGIRHVDGHGAGNDLAYPAQVLVDEQGIVRWTYESSNYRTRARPDEVFAAIDGLER